MHMFMSPIGKMPIGYALRTPPVIVVGAEDNSERGTYEMTDEARETC